MTNASDSNGSDPLDAVVADYLKQVEEGTPPDRDELVAAHPELADRLTAFFADLDRIGAHGDSFRLPEVALPEDFGDYEFLGEIGRGGMGVVYRVRQKSLGRIVALKMILSGPLADPSALRRFREEAESLSRLDHPNIVPVYEVGEHRGLPYFTMKLIEGTALTGRLDQYLGDPKAASELLAKVCDAIDHAHQRGVLHQDLIPGNTLVDAAGEPHVTDFGLSRQLEQARTLTSTGAILGTPEYMAPEQAAVVKDLTTAVDVYGLGGVLYALLTGQPPFRADTAYATLRRVIEDLPVPPRRARRGVPRDLETICLKCLEKDPTRRYPSAADLGTDLGRWQKGEPILARRVGPMERVGKWARRRPTAAALLLVSLVSAALVLGGGSTLAWQLAAANGQLTAANRDLGVTTGELETANRDLGGANARLDDSLWLYRREVYNLQLARVGALFETDPRTALDLLYDTDACPIDERDAAWRFYENAARGYELGSRPGTVVARGPALRQRRHEGEERPHDPHQGRRWAIVRAGDEPPGLTYVERHEAVLDRPLRVIDLISGEVKATAPVANLGRKLSLWDTVISRDGETIAWVGRDAKGQSVVVCDVRTGKTFDPGLGAKVAGPQFLTLGPTGRLMLWVNSHEYGKPEATRLVEVRTGKLFHEFEAALEPVSPPVFSPDGRYLSFWSRPKEGEYAVTLFDTETKKLLPAIPGTPDLTETRTPKGSELCFSPDGRHLLWFQPRAAKADDPAPLLVPGRAVELVVHEVEGGAVKPAHTLEFTHPADQVQVSPDGRYVGVAVRDGSVHLIDTTTWKVRRRLAGAWHGREFAFGRDGRVYTSAEAGLSAWDADSGEQRVYRRGDHGHVLGVGGRGELWTTPHLSPKWAGLPVTTWQSSPQTTGLPFTPCGRVSAVGFTADGRSFLRVQTVRRRVKDDSVFDEPFESAELDPVEDGPRPKGSTINGQRVYNDDTTFRLDLVTGVTTEHKGRLPGVGLDDVSQRGAFATKIEAAASTHTDRRGEEWTFEVKGHNGVAASVRPAWLTHARTKERRRWPVDLPAEAIVLAPSPDGQCVLVGTPDGAVELRDVWTGSVRATLPGHASVVHLALWAPDGQTLATLAKDGTIKVWPMRAPPAAARWRGSHMAFTADGRSLIVHAWTQDELRVHDLATGRVEGLLSRPKGWTTHDRLGVSADGRYMFRFGGSGLFASDLATGEARAGSFDRNNPSTLHASPAPAGGFVVGLQMQRTNTDAQKPVYDAVLVRMNLADGVEHELARFPGENDHCVYKSWRLQVTADSREVVIARFSESLEDAGGRMARKRTLTFQWYDAGTGAPLRTASVHGERFESGDQFFAWLNPGGTYALIKGDSNLRVWDLAAGREKWRLPDFATQYTTTEFSPDGRWLAAATARGVVHVWEVETGRPVATDDLRRVVPTGSQSLSVQELRFDPAGRRLAARVKPVSSISSPPEEVVVWDFTPAK